MCLVEITFSIKLEISCKSFLNLSEVLIIDSIGDITPEPKNSIVLFDGKERLIGDERKLVFLKAQSTAGITRLDVIPNCLL